MKLTLKLFKTKVFIHECNMGRHCIWNLVLDQMFTYSLNYNATRMVPGWLL